MRNLKVLDATLQKTLYRHKSRHHVYSRRKRASRMMQRYCTYRTPEVRGLGDLPSTKQTAKPYWRPLSNGGEYIRDKVAEKLLIIFSGPSPYRRLYTASHGCSNGLKTA